MTLFTDASALVAIIAEESGFQQLEDRLDADPYRLCSSLSLWETAAGLCRSYALPVSDARARVASFRAAMGLELVPIAEQEAQIALDAYARFGKGRHPAALNRGDCFAYACAKAHDARLLFKGEDFRLTDIRPA